MENDYIYDSKKEEPEPEDEIEEEIEVINDFKEKKVTQRITLPVMTIYEKVEFLKIRSLQLDQNYKTLLEPEVLEDKNLTTSMEIAIEEFESRKFPPINIKRPLPNGNYEIWSFDEFDIIPE